MSNAFSREPITNGRRLLVLAFFGTAVAAIGFSGGWMFHSQGSSGSSSSSFDETVASPGRVPAVVCIGSVDVERGVVSLHPSVPGRVVEVCVRDNDAVSAGTVLLKLDDELARFHAQAASAAVQAAEAQHTEASKAPEQHQFLLAQQQAALAAAQHDLAAAHLIATQKEHLFKGKFLAREEVDAAQELVAKLKAAEQAEQAKLGALKLRDPVQEVKRALADVTAKKALSNKARYALKETVLKAPSDGTVLRLLVNPGEVLGPQPKQPALLFAPREPRIVRAELEQEFAGRVFVGQRAVIRDDTGNSGDIWQGSVARLSEWYAHRRMVLPDTLPVQEVRTLECIIQIESGQAPLRIGQRVRVTLANE